MKSHLINFLPASSSSPLLCPDGEIQNSSLFFPDDKKPGSNPDDGNGSDSSASSPTLLSSITFPLSATGISANSIPAILHPLSQADACNAIFILDNGSLAFVNSLNPSSPTPFTPPEFPSPSALIPLGDFLIIISGKQVYYSTWNNSNKNYTFPYPLPNFSPLQISFSTSTLKDYLNSVADLPECSISVPCPSSLQSAIIAWLSKSDMDLPVVDKDFVAQQALIEQAVARAIADYIKSAEDAGLHLFPSYLSYALVLTDNNHILFASPALANPFSQPLKALVASCSATNGYLTLRLRFSRRPIKVSAVIPDCSLPLSLRPISRSLDFLSSGQIPDCSCSSADPSLPQLGQLSSISVNGSLARGWSTIPTTLNTESLLKDTWHIQASVAPSFHNMPYPQTPTPSPAKEEIHPVGFSRIAVDSRCSLSSFLEKSSLLENREFPLRGNAINQRLFLYANSDIMISSLSNPFHFVSISTIEGEEISSVVPSLRSLSSGQLGEFPLYAFQGDGIRALSPDGEHGYKGVQLICRDIIASPTIPALTSSGVAYLSPRGLIHLQGSSVSVIPMPDGIADIRSIAYHYPSDSLLLLSSSGSLFSYSLQQKQWYDPSISVYPLSLSAYLFSSTPLLPLFPDLFLWNFAGSESALFRLERPVAVKSDTESQADVSPSSLAGLSVAITRPIKLGSFLTRKRIAMFRLHGDSEHLVTRSLLEVSDDGSHWFPYLVIKPNYGSDPDSHPANEVITLNSLSSRLSLGRAWRLCRVKIWLRRTVLPECLEIITK